MKKTSQLKQLLYQPELSFLMEAHNGLSARLVEQTGFSGIWASGLAISASLGVRDNNEASWTQVVDILEFMSDATSIPILLDGDTGYGNFNNVRRLIKKLEQRDIAGVCIEDKLFPKTNSFIQGEQQDLASSDEFCGKIKAAKDTQVDPDFCVVARVEAFIVGLGLDAALARASAYADAGADAVLIHSKQSTATQIIAFMQAWDKAVPVIIVPTKYYATPTEVFRQLRVSTVIWANHTIRSAMQAMQSTLTTIYKTQSIKEIDPQITPVSAVFKIQGADELADAEKRYLPGYNTAISGIILAAGASRIRDIDTPKCMLSVGGKSLLQHQLEHFARFGIPAQVVTGHNHTQVHAGSWPCQFLHNPEYATTTEVHSLKLALDACDTPCIISYGDIIYKHYFIHECLSHPGDCVIVVDAICPAGGTQRDYIQASDAFDAHAFQQQPVLIQADRGLEATQLHGEFVGLIKTTQAGTRALQQAVTLVDSHAHMTDLLTQLVSIIPVHVVYVQGGWSDINTLSDWQSAVSNA